MSVNPLFLIVIRCRKGSRERPETVVGDRAYGNELLKRRLSEIGVDLVTPLRRGEGGGNHHFKCSELKYMPEAGDRPARLICPPGGGIKQHKIN